MPRWDLDRYRAEILTQTDLLRDLLAGADPTVHVPTCPEWNLGQLARHVGGAHRWVETIVRTRATEPVSDALVNDVFGYGDEDTAVLDAWLADGARRLADAFADACRRTPERGQRGTDIRPHPKRVMCRPESRGRPICEGA
ncbi:maleylpyruvate isomerase N-terminal domain-containing protein [Streptomyces sp. MMS24-I2-30]|uniref:maleylpyruvate isomerase N-terminal domain-containing protein n=1 Tax=Streptomyces sp. MMS24-I2-30 TaxID=3351564 RepID=UPI003896D8AC